MIVQRPVVKKLSTDDRKGIIGSSSVGAIAGFPGYVTEYRTWRDFMGYRDEIDSDTAWTYKKGHILEGSIADMFTAKTGIELTEAQGAYTDPEHPELICHPDREAEYLIGNDMRIALECKTANSFAVKNWGPLEPVKLSYREFDSVEIYDGRAIPPQYYAQCQWYYAICGYDDVFLARLTDGEIFIYHVPEDEEMEKFLYSSAIDWIEKVRMGYIPEITAPADVRVAYPHANAGTKAVADDEDIKLFRELLEVEKAKKEASDKEKDLKLKIAAKMKEAEMLVTSEGVQLVTYREETRETFDSKKFRAEFPDIADDYITVSSRRVMRIPQKMRRG